MPLPRLVSPLTLGLLAVLHLSACASDPADVSRLDGGMDWPADAQVERRDGGTTPDVADTSAACPSELCWMAGSLAAACGDWMTGEDFSSGRYGAHAYTVHLRAGVATTVTLTVTGGAWSPALLVQGEGGTTLSDGEIVVTGGAVTLSSVRSGRGGDEAAVTLLADADVSVVAIVTSWDNHATGFTTMLPTDATYTIAAHNDCMSEVGVLYSPPNFDENDVEGGYHLLPQADPEGLYTRRADDCSRGTRLLIDVIYTAALRWREARPDLPALAIGDLNEGPCSSVDHATHDDGTHVDLSVRCGTEVSCTDDSAAITLAKIFVDTGSVCGILFNDTAVQAEVNAYFDSMYDYEPWDPGRSGVFMRTVSGHIRHFHVRVFKPDGTCN